MFLIKSARGLKRLLKDRLYSSEIQRMMAQAPVKYPCYVYFVTESFAYEKERPVYLYREDVQKMIAVLAELEGKS